MRVDRSGWTLLRHRFREIAVPVRGAGGNAETGAPFGCLFGKLGFFLTMLYPKN